jgi:FKBP-type peptidyl-prolyl cis-trans isomerase 2
VKLSAGQAFGARDPSAILELDRDEFPADIAAGDEFEAENDEGDSVPLVVLEVGDDFVVVDMNHPLAGQSVTLWLCVEAVRPALTAEIEEAVQLVENGGSRPASLLPAASLVRRPSTLRFDSEQPEQGPPAAAGAESDSIRGRR